VRPALSGRPALCSVVVYEGRGRAGELLKWQDMPTNCITSASVAGDKATPYAQSRRWMGLISMSAPGSQHPLCPPGRQLCQDMWHRWTSVLNLTKDKRKRTPMPTTTSLYVGCTHKNDKKKVELLMTVLLYGMSTRSQNKVFTFFNEHFCS